MTAYILDRAGRVVNGQKTATAPTTQPTYWMDQQASASAQASGSDSPYWIDQQAAAQGYNPLYRNMYRNLVSQSESNPDIFPFANEQSYQRSNTDTHIEDLRDFQKWMYTNYGYDVDKNYWSTMAKQYNYNKQRENKGLFGIEFADPSYDPDNYTQSENEYYQFITNEMGKKTDPRLAEYYFPDWVNSEYNKYYEKQYKEIAKLYGIKYEEGMSIPQYNYDYASLGYQYDMNDKEDARRQELGLPPQSFLDTFDDEEQIAKGEESPVIATTNQFIDDYNDFVGKATRYIQRKVESGENFTEEQIQRIFNRYESFQNTSKVLQSVLDQTGFDESFVYNFVSRYQRKLDGLPEKIQALTTPEERTFWGRIEDWFNNSMQSMSENYNDAFSEYSANAPAVAAREKKLQEQEDAVRTKWETEKRNAYKVRAQAEYLANELKKRPDFENANKNATSITDLSGPGIVSPFDQVPTTRENIMYLVNTRKTEPSTNAEFTQEASGYLNFKYGFVTDDEADILKYYYGSGNYELFDKYLQSIEPELDRRKYEAFTDELSDWVKEKGPAGEIAAGYLSIAGSLFAPLSYVYTLSNAGEDRAFDNIYKTPVAFGKIASDTRNTAMQTTDSEFVKLIESTGFSILDMGLKLPAGPTVALVWMATSAGGIASAEALDRGATPMQAAAYATLIAGVEYVTEKIPLDRLFGMSADIAKQLANGAFKRSKSVIVIQSILKQAGIEATEEYAAEILDNIVDNVVMGDKSEMNQYIAQLISSGMSAEEAQGKAAFEFWIKRPFSSALGGALSGGFFGTVFSGNAIANINHNTGQQEATTTPQDAVQGPESVSVPSVGIDTQAEQNAVSAPVNGENATINTADNQTAQTATEPAVTAQNVQTFTQGKGTVAVRTITEDAQKQFTRNEQKTMRDISKSAKALGVNIQWAYNISHTENGVKMADNGMYDPNTNTLYISWDSATAEGGSPYVAVLGHEISHSLEGTDAYNTIMQYAVKQAQDNGTYDAKMESLRQTYADKAELYLQQELVSDTVQDVFTNKAELRRLVNSQRGVVGAILNAIDSVIGRFKTGNAELSRLRQMIETALNEKQETATQEVKSMRRPGEIKTSTRTSNVPGSILENQNLTKETATEVKSGMDQGLYDYQQKSNAKDAKAANERISKDGVKVAQGVIKTWVDKGTRPSSEDMAYAVAAMIEANQMQDKTLFKDMFANFRVLATELGQAIQITRLLKNMTPEGRYASVQRLVELTQKQVDNGYNKNKPADKRVTIKPDPALVDELLTAETQKEAEVVENQIKADIAKQIPPTLMDKFNAWRYLSMLGNPKTHLRNLFGNASMYMIARNKDVVAAISEGIASKINPNMDRTKAIYNPLSERAKASREFSRSDRDQMMGELQGEGKETNYNEARKIFKTKWLEWARTNNLKLLENEDAIFLGANYVKAMTDYMMANKLSPAQMTGKVLDKARTVAVAEAKRNTFREASLLANKLNDAARKGKAIGVIVEGVVPFKRTPINILKTGARYSPVGLINSLAVQTRKLKRGDITANQFIDSLASSITGTGLMLVGMWLKSLGIIRASGEDKDREEYFAKLKGYQAYALQIGDYSMTLDWINPMNIPLFMGAELQSMIDGAGLFNDKKGYAKIISALATIADPMTEMSMLQGINRALQTIDNDDTGNAVSAFFQSSVYGYFSQYTPTILGQIARTIDPTRRNTYAASDSAWTKQGEVFARKVAAKIPVLSYQLQPYIDMWGEEDQATQNFAMRFVENSIIPWWGSTIDDADPVNMELERLFIDTDDAGILPKYPPNYHKKQYIPSDEIAEYRINYGQTARNALEELFDMKMYDKLPEDSKVSIIKNVYMYATAYAKDESSLDYTMTDTMQKVKDATKQKIDIETYFLVREIAKLNDETTNISQEDAEYAINLMPGLSTKQRAWLYWSMGKSWKYNPYIADYKP